MSALAPSIDAPVANTQESSDTSQPMDIDLVDGENPKYMTPETRNDKLLEAATSGELQKVKALVAAGADIQTTDSGGNSPLHRACWKGKSDVVRFLIDSGAAVEMGTLMGNTPLHRAAYNGHTDAVRMLLDAGADVEARCRYGHTAMFAAAHYGHLQTLQHIMARECDLDARNDLGQTALHVVAHKCQKNAEEIIECLLQAGVDMEATEDQGYTAMHSAAYFGRMDCVSYLVARGADIEARGHHGFTPLLSATLGIRHDIIQTLLSMGANWSVVSTGPETISDVLQRAKRSEGYKNHKADWDICNDLVELWTNASKEELILQCLFKKLLNIPGNKMTQFSGWMVGKDTQMRFGMTDFLWTTRTCEQIGTELAAQYSPYPQGTRNASVQTVTAHAQTGMQCSTSPKLLMLETGTLPLSRRNSSPPAESMQEATGRDEKLREVARRDSLGAKPLVEDAPNAGRKRSMSNIWKAFTSASYYFSWGQSQGANGSSAR